MADLPWGLIWGSIILLLGGYISALSLTMLLCPEKESDVSIKAKGAAGYE